MAQKIATVSTVFAACERLDAANERWNREDVRNEVGGGGYVVIDPLIRAWRALKPLREVAPSTPTELLHQVAASLETHIAGYMGEAEERLAESQTIFDATVSELSEKLAGLEARLEDKEGRLNAAEQSNSELVERLEQAKTELDEAQSANARLVVENDGLSGQIARMEKEHRAALLALQAEAKDLVKQQARERSRLSEEHATALANQRKELTAAAEQAENRLMRLLDQERQDAKYNVTRLSDELKRMGQQSQSNREAVVALETTVKALTRRNEKLESDLVSQAESSAKLQEALEAEKARAASVDRAFNAYKVEHKIGRDLSELRESVLALQLQLRKREAGENE